MPLRFLVVVALWLLLAPPAKANIDSCTASIDRNTSNSGTTADFTFHIENAGPNPATWIKITSPSSNFTINSASSAGWSSSTNSSDITLTESSLNSGSNLDVTVNLTPVDSQASAQSWMVQMSENTDGNSPINCAGSLDLSIVPVPIVDIGISNIQVTAVSASSVTINWSTSISSDSTVNYSTTPDYYDLNQTSSTPTTTHTLTLNNLTADTTYHANIVSNDGSGHSSESGDFTFNTASVGTTVSVVTVITPTPTNTPAPTPTPIPDTLPPKISLTTNLSKPFYPAPKITGVVTDNKSISQIQYSLTAKGNWIPVDTFTPGAKITFSFTPTDIEDGSYPIRIKATDPTGNTGYSTPATLVIDRLPPQVSLGVISHGPQILSPGTSGNYTTLVGLPLQLSCLTSGGPTDILITNTNSPLTHLSPKSQTDFWTGVFTPTVSESYTLIAKSIDGAGNQTTQTLPKLTVLPAGQVVGGPASVSVYVFDSTSQKFLLWDGLPYGIKNPQPTDSAGNYYFILPSGRYYLEASAPKYRNNRTTIFELNTSTPVNPVIKLNPSPVIHFGTLNMALPSFSPDTTQYSPSTNTPSENNPSINKPFPITKLQTKDATIITSDLLGQPKVITFLSPYLPNTSTQLASLKSSQVSSIVIFPNLSPSQTYLFGVRGNYSQAFYSDPDGLLVAPLSIFSSPTHVFVNKEGIVKQVITGLLSPADLIHNIPN